MLTVSGVSICYPGAGVPAVDNVDLQLQDGEVLALLGPSGCGKSTLLRGIAGLEPVIRGQIRWGDIDLARVPVHRRQFGLMFQDGVLFPHRTVAGNIGYGLRGNTNAGAASRVEELLELVGLPGYGKRKVGTLSGGEQQRVALARALAPRPRLLLLDEPLAALDASLRSRLLEDLGNVLRDTGTTALYVTHDQAEAFGIADRMAVMNAGAIAQTGTPTDVWQRPIDAWVAGFVGYSNVLDVGHEVPGLPDGRIALRPAALVARPTGTIAATVLAARPTPDGVRLRVRLEEIGRELQAVADRLPAVGERIAVAVDLAGVAVIDAPTSTDDINATR